MLTITIANTVNVLVTNCTTIAVLYINMQYMIFMIHTFSWWLSFLLIVIKRGYISSSSSKCLSV